MTTPTEPSHIPSNPFSPLLDFRFTRFITVRIIQVLYLVGIALIALTTLLSVIGAFQTGAGTGILALIFAPFVFVLSVLVLRVYLELIAVIFRIAENTTRLVDAAEKTHGH